MELPLEFLARMERILGGEYGAFLDAYERPRQFGLRVNTMKISAEEFQRLAPFHLTRIPWIENGFYYEKEDDPARHPLYSAGLYYLQEPSAMTPAQVLSAEPGEWVLDLCAAPGGKATALGAKLRGQGLLLANDASASRAKALLKNLEVFGISNAFVTNTRPDRLAEEFLEAFDRILVDAPCSGEGMFRKDAANARAWSLKKVEECAALQREIAGEAVRMLRPGGRLLYSTCTFSPEEDEGTVAWLLAAFPEMELLEIPWYEGYSHGRPDLAARLWGAYGARERGEAASFSCIPGQGDAPGAMGGGGCGWLSGAGSPALRELCGAIPDRVFAELTKCVRIYPHRMGGEGHFLALLRKRDRIGMAAESGRGVLWESSEEMGPRKGTVGRKSGSGRKKGFSGYGSEAGGAGPRKPPGSRVCAPVGSASGERAALLEFFRDMPLPFDRAGLEIRKGQVYYVPTKLRLSRRVPFLRNGLYVGEVRSGRFEPSQSLAMALTKEQVLSALDFPQDDPRVRQYLRGETVQADDLAPAGEKGWQLVCVSGYPLGWGKLVDGTLKNKYHPGWRMSF